MKLVCILFGFFFLFNLTNGNYEINVLKGIFKFNSEEEETTIVLREFTTGSNFKTFNINHSEIIRTNSSNVELININVSTSDPNLITNQPVRFHQNNRLMDNTLLIVKDRLCGNNIRDGYRYVFYFYGINSLDVIRDKMDNELGLFNKYELTQFKKEDSLTWIEVRSRFIVLEQ